MYDMKNKTVVITRNFIFNLFPNNRRKHIPLKNIVLPIIPSTVERDKAMCHGVIAIKNEAKNAIIFLLKIKFDRTNTGKTIKLPKNAVGKRTANSFIPKIYVEIPAKYIGPIM